MASAATIRKTRKKIKDRKLGRQRKRHTDRDGSTLPAAVLFGDTPKQ